MKTFEINGKEYVAKKFDFNMVCDLEDMGISLADAGEKPMSMVRAYFAICANKNREFAGSEMEAHLANGGSFDGIMSAMSDELEKSDFFRNLGQTKEQKTGKSQSKEK